MTDNKKLLIGGAIIATVCIGVKVYRDKSTANTALKIKKAVGLADNPDGLCCGLADADGTLIAESTEVNAALKSIGAPFYSLCGRKGLSFRKHGISCNNEENIYSVSEKVVNNWLKKNKDTSLSELVKTGGASAKNTENPQKNTKEHKKSTENKTKKIETVKEQNSSNSTNFDKWIREVINPQANNKKSNAISVMDFSRDGEKEYFWPKDFIIDGVDYYWNYDRKHTKGRSLTTHGELWFHGGIFGQGKRIATGELTLSKLKLGFKEIYESLGKTEVPKKKAATPKSDKVTIIYGDSMELEAAAETHAAKYGIIELSDLMASHNWNNYSKNDNYPPGCQERQYHDNKQLQANVEMRAKNFKPTHLINEDLTAESGPSIINPDGVVLGGNSRVMILNRVKAHNSSGWKAYQEKLYSRAENFGFDGDKLDMFENPVLVRVVSVNMDRCSHYSWVFNTSTKNDTDASDRAITLAKDISDKTIYELSQVIEEAEVETFAQMYEDKSVSRKIEKILSDSGVINSSNHTAWIKDGSFTATAKIMIESILIGTILNDKKLVESAKNYTSNIIRSISSIIKIRSFPEPWNLIKDFEAAIKLEESRRSSKQPKGDFVKQAGMFGDKPTERNLLVWDLLDLKPTAFKKAAKDYARIATNQLNSDDAFFDKVDVTPIEALKKVLDKADGLSDKSRKRRKHGRK